MMYDLSEMMYELAAADDADGRGNGSERSGVRHSGSAVCPICEKPVDLMDPAEAARCFKTDEQDIEFLAKSGDIHRIHNRRGEVMICCNSLFACFDKRPTRLLDSFFEEAIQRSGRFEKQT
jgi:hypothetical protein